MLNIGAKFLLVATSLSPVLGAVAVKEFERCDPWTSWIWWIVVALCLVTLCQILLKYAEKNLQTELLYVKEFERKDQEMLAFLFIYLLPFVRSEHAAFVNEWLTSVYILMIIVLAIAHAGAFHFNPVMRLLGYRFYAIRDRHGVSNLLISGEDLLTAGMDVRTVRIARNVYLGIGAPNA